MHGWPTIIVMQMLREDCLDRIVLKTVVFNICEVFEKIQKFINQGQVKNWFIQIFLAKILRHRSFKQR